MKFCRKKILIFIFWVRYFKDSKVFYEFLVEFGDVSGGVWIDCGVVCDIVDIALRVCVLIVEVIIINVFFY